MLLSRGRRRREDFLDHVAAFHFVAVEGPSETLVVAFGGGFADVVEDGGPAKPEVVALSGDVVENLEGVEEVVFVAVVADGFDAFEVAEFGEEEGKETCFLQEFETQGGVGGEDDFVEFGGDALGRDDAESAGVALDGVEGFGEDVELELGGETDGAHHTEGVVAEGDVGVEGGAYEALVEVADAAEGVEELPEGVVVERYGHGVDGEVAPVLVVLEGAVLHNGFAAFTAVAFASSADKFDLPEGVALAVVERGGAVVFEYNHLDIGVDGLGSGLCQVDAVAQTDDVDVGAGALEEVVAYHSAHGKGLNAHGVGGLAYDAVDGVVENKVHGVALGVRHLWQGVAL